VPATINVRPDPNSQPYCSYQISPFNAEAREKNSFGIVFSIQFVMLPSFPPPPTTIRSPSPLHSLSVAIGFCHFMQRRGRKIPLSMGTTESATMKQIVYEQCNKIHHKISSKISYSSG